MSRHPRDPGDPGVPSSPSPARCITLVTKILADGSPCPKCADVEARLEKSGQIQHIDRVVIADERDPGSEGMIIAAHHGVTRAPFFLVQEDGDTRVYTVYFKFVKSELGAITSPQEEARELLNDNPDLDFI